MRSRSTTPRVLVVGAGGLGAAAAPLIARHPRTTITVIDSDVVERSNLHRQTWFDEQDVGAAKADRAAVALAKTAAEGTAVVAIEGRLRPENARSLIGDHDLIVEGADNFATKFLVADVARELGVPVVAGGVVRWSGWALARVRTTNPCLRCVFEEAPGDGADTCSVAGVVGPAVGVVGALMGGLALRWLVGRGDGGLFSYDALSGRIRDATPRARRDCALCGSAAAPPLRSLDAKEMI
jgi:adenylyltransferase/sulfurtransferase